MTSNTKILQPLPNLTKKERLALRRLKKNEDIIITNADKGDTTIVMDTTHLVELAHKHLSDLSTYQLLVNDPTAEIATGFNRYILECKDKRVIFQQEF